jgi:hypothetical protein
VVVVVVVVVVVRMFTNHRLPTYVCSRNPFLDAVVRLLDAPEQESEEADLDEEAAFTSVYTPLSNASTPDHHPFPGVDSRKFLATKLRDLSARQSIAAQIAQLDANISNVLANYFRAAGFTEPFVQ